MSHSERNPEETSEAQVSFDDEPLILCSEDDVIVGHLDKAAVHRGEGMLHRAFSAFLFDGRGRLLLQRRSAHKPLWPGFWSNSCCSHPRRGESRIEAVRRRCLEELGLEVEPEFVLRFRYHARFQDRGSERELCDVFFARCDGEPCVNALEIAETRWVEPDELTRELAREPGGFTPWIALEWEQLLLDHAPELARFGSAS